MARVLALPVVVLLLLLTVSAPSSPATASAENVPAKVTIGAARSSPEWAWPVHPVRIVAAFIAPAHRYAAGHRGIDLAVDDHAEVRAPADRVVAFAGVVVDRDVVTIDHGGGLVTTLEPVDGEPAVGARVRKGERIGTASAGGHAAPGSIHFGVRLDGEYINPLMLFGALPRAVLLPCCD